MKKCKLCGYQTEDGLDYCRKCLRTFRTRPEHEIQKVARKNKREKQSKRPVSKYLLKPAGEGI